MNKWKAVKNEVVSPEGWVIVTPSDEDAVKISNKLNTDYVNSNDITEAIKNAEYEPGMLDSLEDCLSLIVNGENGIDDTKDNIVNRAKNIITAIKGI